VGKKLTLKQAAQNVRVRMMVINTKEGKEDAERELQALIAAAKDERTMEVLAMLRKVAAEEAIQPPSEPKIKAPCADCADIVGHFNAMTGQNCLLVGQIGGHIHQRHLQYGSETCKKVAEFKYEGWKSDPLMLGNINLLTFFRPSNFDRYVNQMNFVTDRTAQPSLPAGDMES
jgi:hypothetical protein